MIVSQTVLGLLLSIVYFKPFCAVLHEYIVLCARELHDKHSNKQIMHRLVKNIPVNIEM